MPKVLVTDNINPSAIPILEEVAEVVYEPKLSADELEATIASFDGLMIRSASTVSETLFAKAPKLKIVGRAGVGTDNVDIKAANKLGCIVVNSPEGNTVAAAEHTLGLLFALARYIPEGDSTLKQGAWERKRLTGVELFGKTLGLIGLGKIGSRVAKACHTLGMKLLVYDPYVPSKVIEELRATRADLTDIWAKADFITVHVPKTPETFHLINADVLAKCKPGVRFVNCARGGIIDEVALVDAVKSGHVAGAALDVFEKEPLPADSPLLTLGERLIVTPHLGASTEEAQINVAIDVAEQIRDFFKSGTARSAVNSPILRSSVLDPVKPYLPMCETLGSFVQQLSKGVASQLEIIAKGSVSEHNTAPLTVAVLKGLLSTTREGVNYVNAQFLAEERGLIVKESKTKSAGNYSNQVTVALTTTEGHYKVSATLLGVEQFHLIKIQEFKTNVVPSGFMLLAPHQDKPGMLAKIAGILGEENINISALQVGQGNNPEQNIMLANLDNEPSKTALQRIEGIEGIGLLTLIRL